MKLGHQLTVEELEQWVAFGAFWQLSAMSEHHAVVELRQCTGELVECRETTDPDVLGYLRNPSTPAVASRRTRARPPGSPPR
jgi:hypothetical protein